MLGVNQVKLTKKSMNGFVHLEFRGNMDSTVEKMKSIAFIELSDRDKTQLKCCLLFICGCSYEQIAQRLGIATRTVSNMLNDEKLESMLSFEYRVLFHKNKSRLYSFEEVSDKIKQAVFTFVAQNGDYHNTSELVHVSERTLSRYFSHPELQNILNDSTLYFKFLEVRDASISEKNSKAAQVRFSKKTIKEDLANLKPCSLIHKKYLKLADAILVHDVQDMATLKKMTGMTQKSIENYLTDISRSMDFFPDGVLRLFEEAASKIYFANEFGISSEEYERMIIQFYMSGRYSYAEVENIFGLGNKRLRHLLHERGPKLLSEEEYSELCAHAEYVKRLCIGGHSNKKRLVQSQRMIELVKPEFIYVREFEYQLLSMLVDFLTAYESLQYDASMASVIKVLIVSNQELKRLLTEEAYSKMEKIFSIEDLLLGNHLKDKYQYISSVVKEFFNCELDLCKTSEQLEISVPTLIRILSQEYVSINYGPVVSEYVKQTIKQYKAEFEENKEKNKQYQINTYMSVPVTRFEKK